MGGLPESYFNEGADMITIYGPRGCDRCHELFHKLTKMKHRTRPVLLEYLEGMEDTDRRDDMNTYSLIHNSGKFPVIDMAGVMVNEGELMKYLKIGKEAGIL